MLKRKITGQIVFDRCIKSVLLIKYKWEKQTGFSFYDKSLENDGCWWIGNKSKSCLYILLNIEILLAQI